MTYGWPVCDDSNASDTYVLPRAVSPLYQSRAV